VNRIHADLSRVIEAVEIVDHGTVKVSGTVFTVGDLPSSPNMLVAPFEGQHPEVSKNTGVSILEVFLTGLIYQLLYTRPQHRTVNARGIEALRDFQNLLSQSNGGSGTWEPGWTFAGYSPCGKCILWRYGIRFWVQPSHVDLQTGTLVEGSSCRVLVPKEYKGLLPSFYLFTGNERCSESTAPNTVIRLYLHLTATIAPAFVERLSHSFNASCIPFRAKVLNSPDAYCRADAGTVYLTLDAFLKALRLVRELYTDLKSSLRRDIPMFTLRMAPGLAFADDPQNGSSFGQHRCLLIARGLLRAFTAVSRPDVDVNCRYVEEVFVEEGLDPGKPYLGPLSTNDELFSQL
jgi:hypothetical protein